MARGGYDLNQPDLANPAPGTRRKKRKEAGQGTTQSITIPQMAEERRRGQHSRKIGEVNGMRVGMPAYHMGVR